MFLKLFLSALSSELTKQLIGLAIRKLVEHKSDGVTKEVIEAVLDGAVESRRNTLTEQDTLPIKKALAGK